jgi:hypothetical protein
MENAGVWGRVLAASGFTVVTWCLAYFWGRCSYEKGWRRRFFGWACSLAGLLATLSALAVLDVFAQPGSRLARVGGIVGFSLFFAVLLFLAYQVWGLGDVIRGERELER